MHKSKVSNLELLQGKSLLLIRWWDAKHKKRESHKVPSFLFFVNINFIIFSWYKGKQTSNSICICIIMWERESEKRPQKYIHVYSIFCKLGKFFHVSSKLHRLRFVHQIEWLFANWTKCFWWLLECNFYGILMLICYYKKC